MRTSTAITLLMVGAIGTVTFFVTRGSTQSLAERFAAIEQRIAAGVYDHEEALGSLDLALSEAHDTHASELAGRIRLARGKLLTQLGAYDRARIDLEAVLEQRGGERMVEELLIDLEARAGDFRAGLARVTRLIESDPAYCGAWIESGRLHRLSADRTLAHCATTIERTLVPEDARAARELSERAAALDPRDARRVVLAHELRGRFGYAHEKEAEEVLRSIDQASTDLDAAREAYAHSLEIAFEPEALASLLELLRRAGRIEEGLDLATAALPHPAVRSDLATAHFLIRELGELGRNDYGAEIAMDWLQSHRPAPPQFWLDCLRVLHFANLHAPTIDAAHNMMDVGYDEHADIGYFFIGLSLVGVGAWSDGCLQLERFVRSKTLDPFPNARAYAWREVARASREHQDLFTERKALQGAVELQPDFSGELWLRLADLEIASPHAGYRQPELHWAIGMSMLAGKTEELLPRWREIGDLELRSAGLDIETIRHDLAHGKVPTLSLDPSPYELYTLAQLHLAAKDPVRAADCADQLLSKVPGFVPGIDLALDIALEQQRPRETIDRLLDRLQAVSLDERNATILRAIPSDQLTPRDLVAVLRSDPERTGRLAIARAIARNGDPEQALAMLDRVGIESLDDDSRALAAELALALRQPERAYGLLAPLASRLKSSTPSLTSYVDAALQCGEREALDAVITRIAGEGEPQGEGRKTWIALADRLLAGGSPRSAEALLQRLERGAPELRGGDVIVGLAAAALARGDLAQTEAALERAQAFDNEGENELVSLLAAVHGGRFDDLKPAVAALRATDFVLSPLQAAALDALVGQHAPAEAAIVSAQREHPADPVWEIAAIAARSLAGGRRPPEPFVFGSDAPSEAERLLRAVDPRTVLGWLVALPTRLGAGWVREQIDALLQGSTGELWPSYFAAELARAHGEFTRARKLLEDLVECHPDSRPAWDRLEDTLAARRFDAPERIQLRIRRQAALGEEADDPVQRWFEKALVHQQNGELDVALRYIRRAAEVAPESSAIQAKHGEIAALRGELAESFSAWREVCLAAAPASNLSAVPAYLAALAEAAYAAPAVLTRGEWNAELETLRARHPDDPRIVIAQAHLDLEREEINPTFLVTRAYARLDRFRESHADVALENLALGSAAEWAEFYLALDPARAEALLERELMLEPGSLSAWALLGRVRGAAGKPKQAIDDLALARRLAPSGRVLREYMEVKLRGEWSPDNAAAVVRRVLKVEGRSSPDPELAALQARAHFHLGPRGAGEAIGILGEIFARGDLPPSTARSIGRDYALALLARGNAEDVARAREVLQVIEPMTIDPYERHLMRACSGLARPTQEGVAEGEGKASVREEVAAGPR